MPSQQLQLDARLESLALISEFIETQIAASGLDEHAAWEVQLAVDEAATNIIQHAYHDQPGTLTVQTTLQSDAFEVQLRDHGRTFNPENIPAPDLVSPLEQRRTGGLGLYLMRKLMDDVSFEFLENENVLTMTKRIRTTPYHIVSLRGRVDAASVPEINRSLRTAIASGHRYIVLDMRDVHFLSSSGLRTLLLLARDLRRDNGDLVLCALQPQVAEVFHLTGFDQIFSLHHTHEEAAASFVKGS